MAKKPTKPKAAKAAAKKEAEVKLETIPARHDFSETEKGELGIKLAGLTQEKTRTEEEKKVHMSQWTNKVKTIQGSITEVSQRISAGFEMRDTECEVRYDWKKGDKTYTRKSDGKVLETRKIEEHERQQRLFEEEKEKRASEVKPGQPLVPVSAAIAEAEKEENESEDSPS